MTFNVYGTERACRAEILAGSATDAAFHIDCRNLYRIKIMGIRGDHLYRPGRTMACAVTALQAVGQRYAILFYPYGMTDLFGRLLRDSYGTYRPGGTNLAASGTFRTAVAPFVGYFGLHQCFQSGGGTQHAVRTD